MKGTVTIDCFPESASKYVGDHAIVAVDVIRATTMAVTAVSLGRRCLLVASCQAAFQQASRFPRAILAGELKGDMPVGFEMNNSPAELVQRADSHRPLILLSSSGTQLVVRSSPAPVLFLSCFRNSTSTGEYLIYKRYDRVAVIGAGSRGEFREEDQICCAWIARQLILSGYSAGSELTKRVIDDWGEAEPEQCLVSHSVDYLKRTGQDDDLEFILKHVDDLKEVVVVNNGEASSLLRCISASTQTIAVASPSAL